MERGKIVYLSGKISGNQNYKKEFDAAELFLAQMGYVVINPTNILNELGKLSGRKRMRICYALIDVSEVVFMVSGWQKSRGANAELSYAKSLEKEVKYQDYYAPFRKMGESDEIGNSD